jgi:hypothetical protein
MTPKLIVTFTVAAFALAGTTLAAPGNAFAEDGSPAATPSNHDPDQKEKRRKRRYDWTSMYQGYRNYDWTNAERHDRDRPRRKQKDNDTDRGYDWRSFYHYTRDRGDADWTNARQDRDRPRRKRKDDDTGRVR